MEGRGEGGALISHRRNYEETTSRTASSQRMGTMAERGVTSSAKTLSAADAADAASLFRPVNSRNRGDTEGFLGGTLRPHCALSLSVCCRARRNESTSLCKVKMSVTLSKNLT